MILDKINPYIKNLLKIKKYTETQFKIIIQDNEILEDERYINGFFRYIENISYYNNLNIRNIIISTYYTIASVILIPIIDNDSKIYHQKLQLYILYLDSLPGLNLICKKYNITDEYIILLEKIIPKLNIFMDKLKDRFID